MAVSIAQLTTIGSFVGMIIMAFLWMDARHDAAGSANIAKIDSQIFTLNLEIAALTSVISRYDGREEAAQDRGEQLAAEDFRRRAQLQEQKDAYVSHAQNLSTQRQILTAGGQPPAPTIELELP